MQIFISIQNIQIMSLTDLSITLILIHLTQMISIVSIDTYFS